MERLTYRAMQVTENGTLESVFKPMPSIHSHQVLLEVEACGVCGADLSDIKNNLTTKRVIGHEIIGRIIAKGESVANRWQIGQRVGVGRLGGHCNQCDACRAGQFVHCERQSYVGSSRDGGFAELMVEDETGLVAVPIGGGLAGLYLAYQLEKQDEKDYLLLESSDHFGGRASGLKISENHELELGATWFWRDMQPDFAAVIDELGLATFDQPTGKIVLERTPAEAPHILAYPYVGGQRVQGGMSQLINALVAHLPAEKLRLNQPVQAVEFDGKFANIHATTAHFQAEKIWLAIAPRVAVERIAFSPALPESLAKQWQSTETWMAPHAKFIAQFNRAFWRDQGLSSNARSQVGPMVEIHEISEQDLKTLCEAQLVRLFGEEAKTHLVNSWIKDWAQDENVATTQDLRASGMHPHTPNNRAKEGVWVERLVGVSSEFSPNFPGYLVGAVKAVELVLR